MYVVGVTYTVDGEPLEPLVIADVDTLPPEVTTVLCVARVGELAGVVPEFGVVLTLAVVVTKEVTTLPPEVIVVV